MDGSGLAQTEILNNNCKFNTTNNVNANTTTNTTETTAPTGGLPQETTSLASLQLTAGVLQSYAPPIAKAKSQLKELM